MKQETAIEGLHYQTGQPLRLIMKQGRIEQVENITIGSDGKSAEFSDGTNDLPWIAPGLVDLMISGYNGGDFNKTSFASQGISNVVQHIAALGVTSFYPSLVTNHSDAITELVGMIAEACMKDKFVREVMPGIHLEGPYLSLEDGPRGAHNKMYVKGPDWEQFQRWQDAAHGMIKLVTLSPEWEGSADFIAKCVHDGVTVSIGHTAATPLQIQQAVAAGATMCTHLGNGAHLMLPRHPNYIWDQLAEDRLWPTIIPDGFHLPDAVLKVMMKAKQEQVMLISDAGSLSGLAPGVYNMHVAGKVVLTKEGRLHMASNEGLLAGSAQMLPFGIEHLVRSQLCSLAEAWERASVRPATFMGLPQASGLVAGAPADVVLYRWQDDRLEVREVYKSGQRVTRSNGSTVSSQR